MIQLINKIRISSVLFLLLLGYSCKEKKISTNEVSADFVTKDSFVENDTTSINKINKENKYEKYIYYDSHFQSGGKTDFSEISKEEVIEKFKNVEMLVSEDTISINNSKSFYKIEEMDAKKFFGKEYLYSYYTKVYKDFFDIDIKNTVSYINLDINNNNVSPFKDYFMEGGDAICSNNLIFLNYKRYIICFKKEDNLKIINNPSNCIAKSDFKLPYSVKTNIKNVKYNILKCDNILGVEDFLCNEKNLRYIALPNLEDVQIVLVPMDCSDFNYRYYLLTIFNSKVVANEYVEGEWYEPGDDSYKEITSFSIDENYNVEVKTNAVENGKITLKNKNKFKITNKGFLEKMN